MSGEKIARWEVERNAEREARIEAGGALPKADVRRVLADALDGLHAIGLEHRDLKPEKMMRRRRGSCELPPTRASGSRWSNWTRAERSSGCAWHGSAQPKTT